MNFFLEQFEWVKSFLSDSYVDGKAGKASSTRLFEFAIIWVMLVSFMKISLLTATMVEIPYGNAAIILIILGLKMYRKSKED